MRIPSSRLTAFVKDIADQCMASQQQRLQRGQTFRNYYLYGSQNRNDAAVYNKTYAYLDDLESLLYSPVALKFAVNDPEVPNVLAHAKGRAAATDLRNKSRRSNTDTMISEAVKWGLVRGKCFIKQTWKGNGFSPEIVQPESMGVLRETYGRLDIGMEAFCHRTYITVFEFYRMIARHPDEASLRRKAQAYLKVEGEISQGMDAGMQIIVGAFQPYRGPQDPAAQPGARNVVDWMGGIGPQLTSETRAQMLKMDEVWVWDDERRNWATFWLVGDDMLVRGSLQITNFLSYDTASQKDNEHLVGKHPFIEFTPNPLDDYFWGWPEICNVALLQEAINSRMTGIGRLLRLQEDPPLAFKGAQGVNQQVVAKLRSPGGWFTDTMPTADVKQLAPEIPAGLYETLHEYERMFDEMGGLPPIAKGRGEAGVRSQGHAETLVRMFSPRFKDRALLVERSVEELGSLMLDLAKAHEPSRLVAWVPEGMGGFEKAKVSEFILPPAPGLAPVYFRYADLDDGCTVMVDSHSASPAFAAEAKALLFDLFKIGGMTAEDVIERSDIGGTENLIAGLERREAAKAAEIEQIKKSDPQGALKLLTGGKKK